jgi:hypothetical protein
MHWFSYETVATVSRSIEYYVNEVDYTFRDRALSLPTQIIKNKLLTVNLIRNMNELMQ